MLGLLGMDQLGAFYVSSNGCLKGADLLRSNPRIPMYSIFYVIERSRIDIMAINA